MATEIRYESPLDFSERLLAASRAILDFTTITPAELATGIAERMTIWGAASVRFDDSDPKAYRRVSSRLRNLAKGLGYAQPIVLRTSHNHFRVFIDQHAFESIQWTRIRAAREAAKAALKESL